MHPGGTNATSAGMAADIDRGARICTKRRWLRGVVGCTILAGVSAAFADIAANWNGGAATGMDPRLAIVFGLVSIACATASVGSAIAAFTRVSFYEHAATRRGLFGSVEIRYTDITSFSYALRRQYHRGVYAATIVDISLSSADGRVIRWRARHAERARGFVKWRIEGRDALDDVKEIIAEHVAAHMADQILSQGTTPWTRSAELTHAALVPLAGHSKKPAIAYDELSSMALIGGVLTLYRLGVEAPVARLDAGEANFWPGLVVLRKVATAIEELSPKVSDASGPSRPADGRKEPGSLTPSSA